MERKLSEKMERESKQRDEKKERKHRVKIRCREKVKLHSKSMWSEKVKRERDRLKGESKV